MPDQNDTINAAFFADTADPVFLTATFGTLGLGGPVIVLSNRTRFPGGLDRPLQVRFDEAGVDIDPIDPANVVSGLRNAVSGTEAVCGVVVDMSWATEAVYGANSIETWGSVADRIAADFAVPVLSVYERDIFVEEQIQAAFRAHRQFAAPSGLHDNPYWVPPDLITAPLDEQMSFVLGRVVPDYAGKGFFQQDDRFAARGADPDWLTRPRKLQVAPKSSQSWQIYCLGPLRVYRDGGDRIEWKIRGGAPKKTRTLFAYLLSSGEQGAHTDRIAELLWPADGSEQTKRARLHHTVAMLRKTLGDRDAVLRSGDYYRLNAPAGSWIDISSFEQLCRRGLSLFRRGNGDDALRIYHSAEQLYGGDLFQDLPLDYVQAEQDEWCMPRRIWLREMALKLQRDMSILLRERGKLREALDHCQKALMLDPASDDANIETMRVFHAQGRIDTVARQYRQYRKAMENIGAPPDGSEVQALYLALTRR